MTDTPNRKSWWRTPLFTPLEYFIASVLFGIIVYCIARFA